MEVERLGGFGRAAMERVLRALLAGSAAVATLLAGCGGGGGEAMSSAGTDAAEQGATAAAYTEGTLDGFGSVIVNGVRFDDSGASITDDDGAPRGPGDLRLGMRMQVHSDTVQGNAARASAMRFGSAVLGPVSAVDTAAQTLTVLGQTVEVTTTTFFDRTLAGGLADVQPGAVVDVHGLVDAAQGRLIATRIDPAAGAPRFKLIGTVAALDRGATTFAIGAAAIDYSGIAATGPAQALADGQVVRVALATQPATSGRWVALQLAPSAPGAREHMQAMVRGTVTAYVSSASFSVNGLPVDASAAKFPNGASGLALGSAVKVAGTVRNGTLVATMVHVEASSAGDMNRLFELHGAITSIDTAAKTFVVRGVTVWYGGTVSYVGGSEADLAVGRRVEVEGAVGGPAPPQTGAGAGGGGMGGIGGSGGMGGSGGQTGPHMNRSTVQAVTITFE
jgi:hypothetical protein